MTDVDADPPWWKAKAVAQANLEYSVDALSAETRKALATSVGFPAPSLISAVAEHTGATQRIVRKLCTILRNRNRKVPTFYHFAFHKPPGVLSQPNQLKRDADPSINEALPPGFPTGVPMVGRLDADTEGLVLFTDDGQLVHRLSQGLCKVRKVYRVWVRFHHGALQSSPLSCDLVSDALAVMRAPLFYQNGIVTQPAESVVLAKDSMDVSLVLEVTLTEGRNRQVRRLCAAAGLIVERLVRIRLGPLHLGDILKPGQARCLSPTEVNACYHAAGLCYGEVTPPETIKLPAAVVGSSATSEFELASCTKL